MDWCKAADIEPMFAVNLGTRGPAEAQNFLEYCNHPGGTHYDDLRKSHGYEAQNDIKYLCLGNEMEGHWHTGTKNAAESSEARGGGKEGVGRCRARRGPDITKK